MNKNKKFFNFYYLRSQLICTKEKIILESQIDTIIKNTKIYSHILDATIHQFCSNLKSAKTNILNGNIKKFTPMMII